MKIMDIQIGRLSLPLAHPFKTALRTVERIEDIAVKVVGEDGLVGYGEAPPTAVITGDTLGSITCAIREFIAPAIIGMDLNDLDAVMEKLNGSMVHNTSPKAAVDMALYDLWAKSQGKPLYQLLGNARSSFETDLTISVNPVEEMVRDALEARGRGFSILKIKVGKDPALDVERIAAIRKAVGPAVKLRVDANQGWNAEQSVAIIKAMEDKGLDLELVEQPVKADDLEGLAEVTRASRVPIMSDESCFTAKDALKLIRGRCVDIVNIKLMKCGGLREAQKINAICEAAGVTVMLGCMAEETNIGITAAASLGAALKNITRADLDATFSLADLPFQGGVGREVGKALTLPEEPGFGFKGLKA